jgi:hypothetical protein
MRRAAITTLVALTVLLPHAAWGATPGFAIEGLYGFARPPEADFRAALGAAVEDDDFSESSLQIAGGTLLLNFGAFEIGAIVDRTFGDGVTQTSVGGLVGFRIGDQLRLDLLGEVGGQRYGDIRGSSAEEWLMYVGVRPGIAYRFEIGAPGGAGFLLGVWGFARWNVTDERVRVTVGTVDDVGDVDLGGTTIGATLRAGFEL